MKKSIVALCAITMLALGGCCKPCAVAPAGVQPAAGEQAAAKPAAAKPEAAKAACAEAGADKTVAVIGDRSITEAELEKSVREQLLELENNRFEILQSGLDEMVANELLEREAKARGVSTDDLQKTEIVDKVAEPSEEEVQRIYDENKAQLGGQELDAVRDRIVSYLKQRDMQNYAQALMASLKEKYPVRVLLEAPVVEVGPGGHPSRGGGADAPVTIVAFSDYQCPYCRAAEGTVEKVLADYGNKIRYYHRDYPLPFHANARPAAQAAACAGEQGKYWEFHSALFKSDDLSTEAFEKIADDLGLDRAKFDECAASDSHNAEIEKDLADGAAAGVSGTPAFFVNGRVLSGAQPYEKFKQVIDSELDKAAAK